VREVLVYNTRLTLIAHIAPMDFAASLGYCGLPILYTTITRPELNTVYDSARDESVAGQS